MKRILLLNIVVCAVLHVGCDNKMAMPSENSSDGLEMVDVVVALTSPVTKAECSEGELAINNAQVFVFDQDNVLEAYAMAEDDVLAIKCTVGTKNVYAVANAEPITGVVTFEDLCKVATDLSSNTRTSFVMEGKNTAVFGEATYMEIGLYKKTARVTLTEICTDFALDHYKNQTFVVKSVYLVNAAGNNTFFTPTKPTQWYNMMTDAGDLPDMLNAGISDVEITAQAPYTTAHHMYCYPNPTATDTSDETWSARRTRLVIQAELGGVNYYYPVTLPILKPNYDYSVSVTITRPGSSSADQPVSLSNGSFNIDVAKWTDAGVIEEVI